MNALKNRGDHCHMEGIRASALGLNTVADIASHYVHRHPEVRAKRASKDTAEAPGPSPFEGRFAATSG
jgi:hypothetical protein